MLLTQIFAVLTPSSARHANQTPKWHLGMLRKQTMTTFTRKISVLTFAGAVLVASQPSHAGMPNGIWENAAGYQGTSFNGPGLQGVSLNGPGSQGITRNAAGPNGRGQQATENLNGHVVAVELPASE